MFLKIFLYGAATKELVQSNSQGEFWTIMQKALAQNASHTVTNFIQFSTLAQFSQCHQLGACPPDRSTVNFVPIGSGGCPQRVVPRSCAGNIKSYGEDISAWPMIAR